MVKQFRSQNWHQNQVQGRNSKSTRPASGVSAIIERVAPEVLANAEKAMFEGSTGSPVGAASTVQNLRPNRPATDEGEPAGMAEAERALFGGG